MDVRRILTRLVPGAIRSRVRASPVLQRLVRAAFWTSVGSVWVRLLALLAGILLARVVGKISFGEYGIIQATVGLFATAAGVGTSNAATKHVAELRSSDPERAGRVLTLTAAFALLMGVAGAILLALAAPWLAADVLEAPALTGLLRVAALLIVVNSVNDLQAGALSGFEAFRALARLNLLQGVLAFVGTVSGALAGGVEGALWGLAAAGAITAAACSHVVRRLAHEHDVPLPARGAWGERRVFATFQLPGILAGLMVFPIYWYGQALLARQDGGYGGLAEFAVGTRWQGVAILVPSLLCAGYLPVLSSFAREAVARKRALMWNSAKVAAGSAAALALAIAAVSGLLLRAYGPQFVEGRWVLIILLGQAILEALNMVMRQTLTAMDRVWVRVGTNFVWAAAAFAFILLFVPRWGAIGLAISFGCAQVIHLALQAPLAVWSLRGSDRHG